jgi:hypothetical protein
VRQQDEVVCIYPQRCNGDIDPARKTVGVRWARKRREAKETQQKRCRDQLRQAVAELMSDYDCQVEQEEDWIEVRGDPGTCRFRIDLAGDLALLDAGDTSEYVAEWVLSRRGELGDLVSLLQRIVSGDLADVPPGLNNVRLEGYSGYASSAPPAGSP